MTYEIILILTRYLAQWRRGRKHLVGVGLGAGAEIRGGYRWRSDGPSQPKLCHPLITQSCRQCSVGASARFGRHAGKKKPKKNPPIAMQSHGSLRGVPPESTDPAAAETILHSLLIFHMAGKHGAAATAGAARI